MIKMELEGIDELLAKTEELGRLGGRIENEALKAGAEVIVQAAKNEAPVRTGRTKEEIGIVGGVRTKDGIKTVKIGALTGRTSTVLHFLEKGTSKMPANPFLSRAFEANKDIAQKIMIANLKRGLGL